MRRLKYCSFIFFKIKNKSKTSVLNLLSHCMMVWDKHIHSVASVAEWNFYHSFPSKVLGSNPATNCSVFSHSHCCIHDNKLNTDHKWKMIVEWQNNYLWSWRFLVQSLPETIILNLSSKILTALFVVTKTKEMSVQSVLLADTNMSHHLHWNVSYRMTMNCTDTSVNYS